MTTDGKDLIVSDGSQYLHFWDPITHMEVRWIPRMKKYTNCKSLFTIYFLRVIFIPLCLSSQLYKFPIQDPISGKPLRRLNELEWVPPFLDALLLIYPSISNHKAIFTPLRFARGLIFANVWLSEVIYAIDPVQ